MHIRYPVYVFIYAEGNGDGVSDVDMYEVCPYSPSSMHRRRSGEQETSRPSIDITYSSRGWSTRGKEVLEGTEGLQKGLKY